MTKRFTALLVFSGLVPASALVAQTTPFCESKVTLSSRASVSAAIVTSGSSQSAQYDIALQPRSASLKGLEWFGEKRPTLSIRQERAYNGDKAKWLDVGVATVKKDGQSIFPTWRATFEFNGDKQSTTGVGTSITYLPKLTEVASGLKSDIAVTLDAAGAYAGNAVMLRYSKSDAVAAAKRGADELDKLEKQKAAGTCQARYISNEGLFMPGCFLTSAACDTIGLADDCWELTTLRRFRDHWLAHQPGGAEDIATYYATAPAIAAQLRGDPKALLRLYWTRIVPSALAARIGMKRTARRIYHAMMRDLMTA